MKTLAVNYRPTMQRYMLKQRFVTGGNQLRGWLVFMLGDCERKGWVKSLLNTNKFVSGVNIFKEENWQYLFD